MQQTAPSCTSILCFTLHNLKKVHKLVESFCREQGVSYHEADMLTGTIEVLTHLSKVSTEFLAEFPAM